VPGTITINKWGLMAAKERKDRKAKSIALKCNGLCLSTVAAGQRFWRDACRLNHCKNAA